jgi:hypothetical protein
MIRQKRSTARRLFKLGGILLLLPFILPLALISVTCFLFFRTTLYLLVWIAWVPNGKDILVVYSDSPIWKKFFETHILQVVERRAFVLNWSERKRWPKFSLAVAAFYTFGGGKNFNPLVVIFRPFHRAKCFRFYPAFQEWKHGDDSAVRCLRENLISSL